MKIIFHEDSHLYFTDKTKYDKFVKMWETKGTMEKRREWAKMNSWRYGVLPSATKIIGEIFPFTGGNFRIQKAWLNKVGLKNKKDYTELINKMDEIDGILYKDVKLSQEKGKEAHNYLDLYLSGKEVPINNNGYYHKIKDLLSLLGNIEVMGTEESIGHPTLLYTGTFDGLVKINGEYALIDFKTGSQVIYEKKHKVSLQLHLYNQLIKQLDKYKDIEITKHICISAYENKNKDFEIEGEIIMFDSNDSKQVVEKTMEMYKDIKEFKKGKFNGS